MRGFVLLLAMAVLFVGRTEAEPERKLALRLDDSIIESLGALRGTTDGSRIPINAAELRRRIARLNGRQRMQAVTRKMLIARLAERRRLLESLRRLTGAQERAVWLMRRAQAPIRQTSAPPGVRPTSVASAVPRTAPATPTSAPAAPTSGLLLDSTLVAVIVVLLAWVLRLRGRGTARAAELDDRKERRTTNAEAAASESQGRGASAKNREISAADAALAGSPTHREDPPSTHQFSVADADRGGESPPGGEPPVASMRTTTMRIPADQDALREIDTLIAYEDYPAVERRLDQRMGSNPGNPEYHLRLLHIQAAAGDESQSDAEEQILAAMMDGPLSETISRVREIGRGLMAGHPLFDDPEQVAAARELIARHAPPRGP